MRNALTGIWLRWIIVWYIVLDPIDSRIVDSFKSRKSCYQACSGRILWVPINSLGSQQVSQASYSHSLRQVAICCCHTLQLSPFRLYPCALPALHCIHTHLHGHACERHVPAIKAKSSMKVAAESHHEISSGSLLCEKSAKSNLFTHLLVLC